MLPLRKKPRKEMAIVPLSVDQKRRLRLKQFLRSGRNRLKRQAYEEEIAMEIEEEQSYVPPVPDMLNFDPISAVQIHPQQTTILIPQIEDMTMGLEGEFLAMQQRQSQSNVLVTMDAAIQQLSQTKEDLNETDIQLAQAKILQVRVNRYVDFLEAKHNYQALDVATGEALLAGTITTETPIQQPLTPFVPVITLD